MPVTINGTSGITTPGLDASGTNKFATTIGVGGATPSASGAGITFPATQSTSSDANTLDDYEEGTWTPTIFGGSTAGTTTYNVQEGRYTKIGRQVTLNGYVGIGSATGTGIFQLGGLPFTSTSGTRSASAIMANALNWTAGSYLTLYLTANANTFEIYCCTDDAAWVQQNLINEVQDFIFTFTYFTN
jgi:hypothetical protein